MTVDERAAFEAVMASLEWPTGNGACHEMCWRVWQAARAAAPATERAERIFIDCEFNGGRGALISMALVSDYGEFYEVVECSETIQPWVAANVIPVLGKPPIAMGEFYNRLFKFLDLHKNPVIVADHPADLAYFANAVITDNVGSRYARDWRAECVADLPYKSLVPHNALEDARAIKRAAEPDMPYEGPTLDELAAAPAQAEQPRAVQQVPEFSERLRHLLNAASAENASNTPDFILAQYVQSCLTAYNAAVLSREAWYGRVNVGPGGGSGAAPAHDSTLTTTDTNAATAGATETKGGSEVTK